MPMSHTAPALPASLIRRLLLAWYRKNQRPLPWRQTRDPYRIWISEIMLQQTRAAAAIGYYERFLLRFPTVEELASACEQELLSAWAGLGYYARVRNLQKAANKIVDLGAFPSRHDSIRDLAGVGDYTAAAIASIAFGLPHAALDGNVIRVLSRLVAERGNVASAAVRQRLHATAELLLDPTHPGDFNQACMELGATICLPKAPQCTICPLKNQCTAYRLGCQRELPLKAARANPVEVEKRLLLIRNGSQILVWQRKADSRRLAGFWELPEAEDLPTARIGPRIGDFRHTIVNTKFYFYVHRACLRRFPKKFQWVPTDRLHEIPLSTTARKALACLTAQSKI